MNKVYLDEIMYGTKCLLPKFPFMHLSKKRNCLFYKPHVVRGNFSV